ncbi:MAG: hypothetical protein ACQPRJ_02655 [Solitalea-like symbiont of Acarus siro]
MEKSLVIALSILLSTICLACSENKTACREESRPTSTDSLLYNQTVKYN